MQRMAANASISKKSTYPVLKIISKGSKSNLDKKFAKCVHMLIFLIDNGDQFCTAL